MKRILACLVAIAAAGLISDTTASAQNLSFQNGFNFSSGVLASGGSASINGRAIRGRNFGGGFFRPTPREDLPYFAKFPPVYYSHIVKRPYGISPFAAPSGIAPVEMSIPAPVPVSIKNPYFQMEVEPVSNEAEKANEQPIDKLNNKATWVTNPYFGQATPVGFAAN